MEKQKEKIWIRNDIRLRRIKLNNKKKNTITKK